MAAKKKAAKKKAAKKKAAVRPTKQEMLQRIRYAEELLGTHLTDSELVEQIQQHFKINPAPAREVLEKAIKGLGAGPSDVDVATRRNRAVHRLMNIAATTTDWRAKTKVEELLMRLQGTEVKKADVTLDVDMSKLTDDQLNRLANGEDPTVVLATS